MKKTIKITEITELSNIEDMLAKDLDSILDAIVNDNLYTSPEAVLGDKELDPFQEVVIVMVEPVKLYKITDKISLLKDTIREIEGRAEVNNEQDIL